MSAVTLAYQYESLFEQPLSAWSWADLLLFFQQQAGRNFFPLSPGKPKHIDAAEAILANRFSLNNELHHLPDQFDWQRNPSADLEWLILLHKFYYLKDLACAYDFTRDEKYAQKWVQLVDSWISQVPEGFIDSQVTGRRLQQWLLSYRYFVGKLQSPSITPDFFGRFVQSVNAQTHYLCNHLTPEGNHRTLELYAIFVVAVTFPQLSSASYFLEFAKKHLLDNMQIDLLPDGVHRELSTDYHHTVLKNYLRFRELANLNEISLPEECDNLLHKALEFSCHSHKPDGTIPPFNDGDCQSYLTLLKKGYTLFGDKQFLYVSTQGLEGEAPKQRSRLFEHSGYCILRNDWWLQPYQDAHFLFFDCAGLGFGSHGHYDILSFAAAAYGHDLVVDPGRYTYSESGHDDDINWRKYFKSTAAHNTVVIDGLDQIAYQCERPVDPEPLACLDEFASTQGFDWVRGHVVSQRYPVVHDRSIFFLNAEYWIVTDRLIADDGLHDYDLYFHLSERAHGLVKIVDEANTFQVLSPNLALVQAKQEGLDLSIEQGYVSPEYGIKYPAPVLRFAKKQSASAVLQTVLYPFPGEAPTISITSIAVNRDWHRCDIQEASASKIDITYAKESFSDIFFVNHRNEDRHYSFEGIECRCRILFLRRDSVGRIINLQAEGIDFISIEGKMLLVNFNNRGQISFQGDTLLLNQNGVNRSLRLCGLKGLPYWDVLAGLWLR